METMNAYDLLTQRTMRVLVVRQVMVAMRVVMLVRPATQVMRVVMLVRPARQVMRVVTQAMVLVMWALGA